MIIAIDFDGTCVTHEFPYVGKEIGAVPILKKLVLKGHELVLNTMRSNIEKEFQGIVLNKTQPGNYLNNAIKWFELHGIPLAGVYEHPSQNDWTLSPKAYAELYIDDAALGIPLLENKEYSERPFVDWNIVENMLIQKGIL